MIVAANWKMSMGFKKALEFLSRFSQLTKGQAREGFIFFPPICLSALFQKRNFYWGGQNIHYQKQGAWTGETSAQTLKEMGACFCLLGHSERRQAFRESHSDLEKKFLLLQELALIPVLCVGEDLKNRKNKEKVLKKQLSIIKNFMKNKKAFPTGPSLAFKALSLIVAYEPVWAIGSNKSPSCQEIDETTQFIKEYIPWPSAQVFYGGSLNVKKAQDFSKNSLVDGFLVGRASLDPDELFNIYACFV